MSCSDPAPAPSTASSHVGGAPALIAQISDLHIVEPGATIPGGLATDGFLRAAVARLNRADPQPDAVLISGDLVNNGTVGQYEHLRELLAPLRAPMLLMVGNHDRRGPLCQVFGALDAASAPGPSGPVGPLGASGPVGPLGAAGPADHLGPGGEAALDFIADVGPLRIIGLDSLLPGQDGGDLTSAQLEWLDRRLGEEVGRPTIVALHHPPFASGLRAMDAMGLAAGAAKGLAAVVARHRHVHAVTSGHLHRALHRRWAGTVATVAPSVAHAVACRLAPEAPAAWDLEPPAMLLHAWSDGALVTHVVPIAEFEPHET